MVSATPEHHLILTVHLAALKLATQACKPYILLALLPVTVLLPVVTATIQLQKSIPEHLMVPVAPKQHVTLAEHLVQPLVHQDILTQLLQVATATQLQPHTPTAHLVALNLVTQEDLGVTQAHTNIH